MPRSVIEVRRCKTIDCRVVIDANAPSESSVSDRALQRVRCLIGMNLTMCLMARSCSTVQGWKRLLLADVVAATEEEEEDDEEDRVVEVVVAVLVLVEMVVVVVVEVVEVEIGDVVKPVVLVVPVAVLVEALVLLMFPIPFPFPPLNVP